MTTILAGWNDEQKRISSLAALGVAVVALLASLGVWWFVLATPAWVYWIVAGLLALVLAFLAALVLLKPKAASAEMAPAEAAPEAAPAAEGADAPAAPAAYEPRLLTLRCGDCGTIFEITDTGERPLYHTCPGCGAEGALRDPVEEAPPAEAAPEAAPAPAPSAWTPPPEAAPAPAPAAAAAPAAPAPVKRLKLRCGGCKEVFSIDDTGERPLRRACPHCGRMGQIS